MKITIVAGARPNFMKISPIIHEIHKNNLNQGTNKIEYRLIHTGQHYDKKMSESFFIDLNIPKPHVNLGAGGGTQAEQTAAIMIGFEKELIANPCDLVLVVGDITSTMACAITAQKLKIKVAHVEAGIRSGDWLMPEEINRLVTDSISNYYFTTSELANLNLLKSGVDIESIFYVGNTMIDTLLSLKESFRKPEIWDKFNLKNNSYIVLTLHRPSNVDDSKKLIDLIKEILNETRNVPIIFPVHPRTLKILTEANFSNERLIMSEPLGYLEFNYLVKNSLAVVTDSGGITEETSVLKIPCMTLRDNTERPETIELGTNELLGTNPKAIKPAMDKLFKGEWKKGSEIPLWDGKTSERIVKVLLKLK